MGVELYCQRCGWSGALKDDSTAFCPRCSMLINRPIPVILMLGILAGLAAWLRGVLG